MPRLIGRPGGLFLISIVAGVAALGLVVAHRRRTRTDTSSHNALERDAGALSHASLLDSWRVVRDVLIPTIVKGPIIRRPTMTRWAEATDRVERAVATLQQMRDRYGSGPLLLKIPFRRQAVILTDEDARRVLDESPEPFTPASSEKQAALGHFEPDVSLITRGPARRPRRELNERTLEPECPVHHLAPALLALIDEEATDLLDGVAGSAAELDWRRFEATWMRIVRRAVFGDTATSSE